jgi:hypothetical protein
MTEPRQTEEKASDDRIHSVRWDRAVFERLERAAEVWSERDHISVSAADVIRTGAIKRADDILGPASA